MASSRAEGERVPKAMVCSPVGSRAAWSCQARTVWSWAAQLWPGIGRPCADSHAGVRGWRAAAGSACRARVSSSRTGAHWLREQYQDRQRSLKDIAAETGIPVEALAAAARQAGIRVRHGINGRAHPLAALGGPGAFPPDVWSVFTHPGAEQRIRRLLALPGQPGLHHAARQLGIRNAILTGQVRQLEAVVGTALLRTRPDGRLALTAYGERFARDLAPVLNMLAEPDHGSRDR